MIRVVHAQKKSGNPLWETLEELFWTEDSRQTSRNDVYIESNMNDEAIQNWISYSTCSGNIGEMIK